MAKIRFEELIYIAAKENTLNMSDVEVVVDGLVQDLYEDAFDDEFGGEFNETAYQASPRKKLRDIVGLFERDDLQIFGTADEYHNVAVNYARQNLYDGACRILQRGRRAIPYSVDILADLIKYGISGGQYEIGEESYHVLSGISRECWNWRAFSFSIDYLIAKADQVEAETERSELKKQALALADQFIAKENADQAYFDKSTILRAFGNDDLNNQTEESVLQLGLRQVKAAPKCALRLADILFEKGEYQRVIANLWQCCTNVFKPQPDINGNYAFLLLALSKASQIFAEQRDDYADAEQSILSVYRDFHTAMDSGLNGIFNKTAKVALKVIETQTGIEYPYRDVGGDDIYEA